MSTQAARSILFTHTSPQQGFRLLELPSELVKQLSSKDPPTIELKSPNTTHSSTTTTEPEVREYVNLCTSTQTYRVRQVQSSNSLLVIRPSDGGVERGDINVVADVEQAELNLVETMTSISKCGSTLELHTPQEGFSAVPFLERILSVYDLFSTVGHGMDGDNYDEEGVVDLVQRRGIVQRVFEDVPVSRAECERGWREGIDLGKQFLVSDLWKSVLDDGAEEPFPRPLFEAIVRRVCDLGVEQGGLLTDGDLKWASIDKASCTRWAGETYLEAMAPTSASAIARNDFLNAWRNHLPESWHDDVVLSKLTEGSYKHPEPTTICFVNEAGRQKAKNNVATDASAATAAKKTRNWHELFKNQKRQKH
ncbi:putative sister chromatid cohesion protein Dcc1 [Aspergillus tanneri]|uniref:Sister chromatid cohesion protein Dcc1 n=1 Tax=Aspergillus tanneri TaxID=1220188 RepID=A0A5M9MTP1_9EURO|nr:uncharacterized protein ATNIH1004_004136 [Aspergillus tanneri]KAA8648253.1 hypothetical protein ATNIH1004_004136 [Aspergillus tanneri]